MTHPVKDARYWRIIDTLAAIALRAERAAAHSDGTNSEEGDSEDQET